jgi:hypothetical protein
MRLWTRSALSVSARRQFVPKGVVYRDEAEKLRLETRNGAIQAQFVFDSAN